MRRSFLRELGIDAEIIDKIMAENGKDIEKYKSEIEDYVSEIKELKSKNVDIEIGLRIHLKSLYLEGEDDPVANDRFGLTRDEFLKIIDDLANTKMKLSIIHFHQRGFDYEKDKFEKNFLHYIIIAAAVRLFRFTR